MTVLQIATPNTMSKRFNPARGKIMLIRPRREANIK